MFKTGWHYTSLGYLGGRGGRMKYLFNIIIFILIVFSTSYCENQERIGKVEGIIASVKFYQSTSMLGNSKTMITFSDGKIFFYNGEPHENFRVGSYFIITYLIWRNGERLYIKNVKPGNY